MRMGFVDGAGKGYTAPIFRAGHSRKPMDQVIFIASLLAIGGGVGILSASLGIGGGVLMIPAFILVFTDFDINTAKGTSMMTIMFVAAYNSYRMNRGDTKNSWSLVGAIAIGSLTGGYLGGWITSLLSDTTVTFIFVGLILFAGVRTFVLKEVVVQEEDVRRRQIAAACIGLVGGLVAGATGTGGGAIFVPLVLWAGIVTNERVVALSNTIMVITSASGLVAHLLAQATVEQYGVIGMVNLTVPPLVVLGAILSAPLGRKLNTHLTFARRRVVMGVLLLTIAIRLIYRAIA